MRSCPHNERYVVERLVEARGCSWIIPAIGCRQCADDSADDTTELAQRLVATMLRSRLRISSRTSQRPHRIKAGSLALASSATGEYVAVLDADFVPSATRLSHVALSRRRSPIWGVQTRLGHLNDGFSFLTMAQALVLDIQFAIEHPRASNGGFLNANGTVGIWRRTCIESAGG